MFYSICFNQALLRSFPLVKRFIKTSTMSGKYKIFVTRPDIPESGLKILRESCEITTWPHPRPVTREELFIGIEGKDGLLCTLCDKIDGEVLNRAPNLKAISTMSVGLDHLDLTEIKKRGIRVGYTPDVLTDATAELTIALLLATCRRLIEASTEAANGGWTVSWAPTFMCGPGLSGSTVGIVGFGRIGQAVAKLVRPFNVEKILFYNRSERPREAERLGACQVTFDELLVQSDFVIVCSALTPETTNLFGRKQFEAMKKTCVFINSSRGGLVNQDDLIAALKSGEIWAAGLDVTTPEPLPLDSELFKLKNCLVLPHIGSATIRTRNEMAIITANNLLAALTSNRMPSEYK